MAFDLVGDLRILAESRSVFHSEADFQHALAWTIHEQHPAFGVRLERRPPDSKKEPKTYVDIWAEDDEVVHAIELKYKTRRLYVEEHGEEFYLLDQSALDISRYDFCKDIGRIEALARDYPGLSGFAVILTNDPGYWRQSGRRGNVDEAFRLHQGAMLSGTLEWASHASVGTTSGRTDPICLVGEYSMDWMTYSDCGNGGNSEFRMAVVAIQSVG